MLLKTLPTHGIEYSDILRTTTGVAITVGKKDIVGSSGEETTTMHYFNWFNFKDRVWDYEVYDKKIVDVEHTTTKSGETYTVIAFEDSVQIARFFAGWTYGNRDLTVFKAEDVDIDEFCPADVILNSEERSTIFILSNCKNSQNLIEIKIEEPRRPQFVRSRWISSEAKVVPKEVCMLPDEMILFSHATTASESSTLTSYDRGFSFNKSVIDRKVYDLSEFSDFACVPELNIFLSLNIETDPMAQEAMKELVIYRGGTAMQGMRRILHKISGLSPTITNFQSYVHLDKVVVMLLTKDNQMLETFSFDPKSPTIITEASVENKKYDPVQIDFKAKNAQGSFNTKSGTLQILESLGNEKPALMGEKTVLKIGVLSLNKHLNLQGTPIYHCDLINSDTKKEVTGDQSLQAIVDSADPTISKLRRKVGSLDRVGNFDVIGYYEDSSANTLEFGQIEIYQKNKQSYTRLSALYLPNTLRHVHSTKMGDYIFTSIVTNEGTGSILSLTVAYKGTLSTLVQPIEDSTFYHKANVFISGQKDNSFNLNIVAYSAVSKDLTSHSVTVDFVSPEKGEQVQNKWTLKINGSESTSPLTRIEEYDYVEQTSSKNVNFYVVTEGSKREVGRTLLDLSKNTWDNDDPLQTITFETEEKKSDSLVYGIGCSVQDRGKEAEKLDRCAFSTYGAVVYYAEFKHTETDKEAKTVTAEKVLRLRRIGSNFGKKVFVLNHNVILETERLIPRQTKAALVWDIKKYADTPTGDIAVSEVISLTADPKEGVAPQSRFNSVIIGAIEVVETTPIPIDEFDLVVLNETRTDGQSDFDFSIVLKRLNGYGLIVKKLPTAETFNKL